MRAIERRRDGRAQRRPEMRRRFDEGAVYLDVALTRQWPAGTHQVLHELPVSQ